MATLTAQRLAAQDPYGTRVPSHGTTEYAIITRPNALEFDVATASLQAELWDAPYRAWTTYKFDEVFVRLLR